VHRGIEVGIYLRPDIDDDNFVAKALGNLAAFRLQTKRRERLEWQVLRVDGSAHHHYRLVLRHPERLLDIGFKPELERILQDLSDESIEQLRERLLAAEREGLQVRPLRSIHAEVDYWRDDFWNWLG
jgi:hypothetical protein